jgi:hypothetical protein
MWGTSRIEEPRNLFGGPLARPEHTASRTYWPERGPPLSRPSPRYPHHQSSQPSYPGVTLGAPRRTLPA